MLRLHTVCFQAPLLCPSKPGFLEVRSQQSGHFLAHFLFSVDSPAPPSNRPPRCPPPSFLIPLLKTSPSISAAKSQGKPCHPSPAELNLERCPFPCWDFRTNPPRQTLADSLLDTSLTAAGLGTPGQCHPASPLCFLGNHLRLGMFRAPQAQLKCCSLQQMSPSDHRGHSESPGLCHFPGQHRFLPRHLQSTQPHNYSTSSSSSPLAVDKRW